MKQIVDNSVIYNGDKDILTENARKLLERVVRKFEENEAKLMRLEQQINPLLDDNDQVALKYIFTVSSTSIDSVCFFGFPPSFMSLSWRKRFYKVANSTSVAFTRYITKLGKSKETHCIYTLFMRL